MVLKDLAYGVQNSILQPANQVKHKTGLTFDGSGTGSDLNCFTDSDGYLLHGVILFNPYQVIIPTQGNGYLHQYQHDEMEVITFTAWAYPGLRVPHCLGISWVTCTLSDVLLIVWEEYDQLPGILVWWHL